MTSLVDQVEAKSKGDGLVPLMRSMRMHPGGLGGGTGHREGQYAQTTRPPKLRPDGPVFFLWHAR